MIGGIILNLSTINSALNIFDKVKNGALWLFKKRHQFKKSPYYFKNYHKHLTIYDNGNGIIINSFEIIFNSNDEDAKKLVRGINISDGKTTATFESLEKMKNISLKERFDKYGFWVYSDNNIIKEVKEEYWLDNDHEQEDIKAKNDPKELRWVFKFNNSKIELHKPYHVVYIISLPGMFPIKDGKLDFSELNTDNFDEYSNSILEIRTPTEQLAYTVSFYNDIDLQIEPEAIFKKMGNNKDSYPPISKEYNIIYKKYICYIKSPQLGSKIKIRWKFKGGQK